MSRSTGRLHLIYPPAAEALTCRMAEDDGHLIFYLNEGQDDGPPQTLALQIEAAQTGEGLCRTQSGHTHPFAWAWVGPQLHLWLGGDLFIFQREEIRRRGNSTATETSGDILAPMPGAVVEVLVAEGDRVERNQTLLLMESMKMELAITAPGNAIVRQVNVRTGQQVERGMRLVELAPDDQDGG